MGHFQSLLDGDLDAAKATKLEGNLAIARQSERTEIESLADALNNYLQPVAFFQSLYRITLLSPEPFRFPV